MSTETYIPKCLQLAPLREIEERAEEDVTGGIGAWEPWARSKRLMTRKLDIQVLLSASTIRYIYIAHAASLNISTLKSKIRINDKRTRRIFGVGV